MLMICKRCGKLYPEETMIKMSFHDYDMLNRRDDPHICYSGDDHARYINYVQICEGCHLGMEGI